MTVQYIELKLSAASKRRLLAIADAGVLGRTVDEVVSHFLREALHRDWLEQEIQRERVQITPPAGPRPPDKPRAPETRADSARAEKRLIRLPEVCDRIGMCRTTLYRMISAQHFPAPRRLGLRAVAWLESDIDAWIDSRASG